MRTTLGTLALACLVAVLAGAHALPGPRGPQCVAGTKPGVRAELVLGRNAGHVLAVSRTAFQRFLAEEVTPRFPDGFTVSDASGQWRDERGAQIVREPSYGVLIVLPDADAAAPRLKAIAEAYKLRFKQQSVLVSLSPTCFAF